MVLGRDATTDRHSDVPIVVEEAASDVESQPCSTATDAHRISS